jgi:ATP-dependent DNA helicase PIF1
MDKTMANRGARWTPEQEAWLLTALPKKGVQFCAAAMDRTVGAVEARQCVMAQRRMNDTQCSVEAAAAQCFITPAKVTNFLVKEDARRAQRVRTALASVQPSQVSESTAEASVATARPALQLTGEQLAAAAAIRARESIFLTGQAGTGKSATLRHIIQMAEVRGMRYGVTATTGCAAVLVGGSTIHSFLGIGLATQSAKDLARRVAYKMPKMAQRLRELDFLIIDEVSMLSDALFTKISEYLSCIRQDAAPFGGLTVLLSGDFLQLPPVEGDFAFRSSEWQRLNPKIIQLTNVFRQADDANNSNGLFREILARARIGKLTASDVTRLARCKHTTFPPDFQPTRLYPRRVTVAEINQKCYAELRAASPGAERIYETVYNHTGMKAWADKADIPPQVGLLPGAQVMVTWNLNPEAGIVNGTRGVVIECQPKQVVIKTLHNARVTIPLFRVSADEEGGPGAQDSPNFVQTMPLTLAYAITHHKSQGATLDVVEMDLGDAIFEYGQAYVALSRARSLDSVRITSLKKSSFAAHPEVLKFYGFLPESGSVNAADAQRQDNP